MKNLGDRMPIWLLYLIPAAFFRPLHAGYSRNWCFSVINRKFAICKRSTKVREVRSGGKLDTARLSAITHTLSTDNSQFSQLALSPKPHYLVAHP
jgi:hypothetical protein